MDLAVAATTFILVLPAELPDKTFIASLVLGARYPPLPVWVGVASAFVLQNALAVTAGSLLALAPHRVVEAVTGSVFAAGGLYLLLGRAEARRDRGRELGEAPPSPTRVVVSSFAVIFVAEFGDITQVLTANLAARYHDAASVFTGSTVALLIVAAVGVRGGRLLTRAIPLERLGQLAGLAMLALAGIDLASAVGG